MIGNQERWQEDIFIACSLRDLIPDDHILKQVDAVLDLSWLRDEVRDLYDERQGRPSIDPEAAVRLMLAGFFQGIVHDRKLMREAQVNLAIRWFAGYRLDERLPDHSSLTRIRQRWGSERFKRIFQKTVELCGRAGLVNGETLHVDATLIRADVSWASLSAVHADRVIEENEDGPDNSDPPRCVGRPRMQPKKRSRTDPDATLTTSSKKERMAPSYKQHTAVDDESGVIVDVDVTTGEASEGLQLGEQIDRIESNTGKQIETLTADGGYASAANYAELEERGIEGIIPPQAERKGRRIPLRRFKYDARHQVVRCPVGKKLHRGRQDDAGVWYRAAANDCRCCALRERCVPPSARARSVYIVHGYEALHRARRWRQRWDPSTKRLYNRHRWRSEGAHGEAKTQHGLRRAVRRGLDNVAIQAYLTAAVMNLKRLAAFCCHLLFAGVYRIHRCKEYMGTLWERRRIYCSFRKQVDSPFLNVA
jgi:transposase